VPVSKERRKVLDKMRRERRRLERLCPPVAEPEEQFDFTPDDLVMLSAKPRTRAECANVPRPCPYASCKYHLAVDVAPNGQLTQHKNPEDMPANMSCALDATEEGGLTGEEIGLAIGATRQRAEQLLEQALRRPCLRNVLQEFRC
jgi:hypothetical protein